VSKLLQDEMIQFLSIFFPQVPEIRVSKLLQDEMASGSALGIKIQNCKAQSRTQADTTVLSRGHDIIIEILLLSEEYSEV
jgi:hypothetical protein